jgi:hypothetical protein
MISIEASDPSGDVKLYLQGLEPIDGRPDVQGWWRWNFG